ncbi:tyrosine-protein phosphatase [Romboutsia hominis]|uniref:protein-tyrosine-phosphatase n=1 Tax=Romboutsia hominis TaxID=1507512 RepID=A0A2P2BSK0_9FIRM|nr:CpsB/CapC family capsule biosynthesis tyrosine phosphatase [Romboutsia hominis]CEI73329.1 Tyrosine-protein phosphatase YwqE [Romboutsia hominis]
MIDIHCHILPGVDDGAKSLEEALEMAKIAQAEGIKTIINTSHYHPAFEDYIMGDKLLDIATSFNNELIKNNIDVNVLVGNEIYYNENILEYIDKKEFKSINNSKYVLVEFSPSNFPKNLSDVIFEFKIRGYIPILAHVERYMEIQKNYSILKDAINEGALIQINSSSVLKKGSKSFEVCKYLLDRNLVQFIASDAHDKERRKPYIKEVFTYISKYYGEDRAKTLLIENPLKIINDEDISFKEIELKNRKKVGFIKKIFNRK